MVTTTHHPRTPWSGALPSAFLYVPGDRPELFDKAGDADVAVLLDLEDAVSPARKDLARSAVADHIARGGSAGQVWVRLDNATLERDLAAVTGGAARPAGVMLAKADAAGAEYLAAAAPDLPVIALIESARALAQLDAVARAATVRTFALGEVDLLADLRMRRTDATAAVIDGIRAQIVAAAARHGLAAPLAPTSTDFADLEAFAVTTAHLRDLGFRSRTAIHPSQCAVIVDAFRPSAADIAAAEDLIARLAAAGGAVALDARGRFIDPAVIRAAEETLSRAPRKDERS